MLEAAVCYSREPDVSGAADRRVKCISKLFVQREMLKPMMTLKEKL